MNCEEFLHGHGTLFSWKSSSDVLLFFIDVLVSRLSCSRARLSTQVLLRRSRVLMV